MTESETYLKRAIAIAMRVHQQNPTTELDDLIGAASLALVEAEHAYKSDLGPFWPYAKVAVEREVVKEVLAQYSARKLLSSRERELKADPTPKPSAYEPVEHAEIDTLAIDHPAVRNAVCSLPGDLMAVVVATVGLDCEQQSWDEIAESLGVARRTVIRRWDEAISILRQELCPEMVDESSPTGRTKRVAAQPCDPSSDPDQDDRPYDWTWATAEHNGWPECCRSAMDDAVAGLSPKKGE